MEDIIIYGSGGMASEVVQIIEDSNLVRPAWNILGYIDDFKGDSGEIINGYKIIGSAENLKSLNNPTSIIIAMSDPKAKKRVYNNIKEYNLTFPTLIHPTARVAHNAKIGEGCVIGMDSIVSVKVNIANFVFVNMRSIVGHDSEIHDFSSCLLNSVICGNVTINEGALVGSNSVIMQKKVIGKWAKISMGSVVSFDVKGGHVVLSRPSKSMYFGNEV